MTASDEITGSANLEYCSKHFDRFKKKATRHSLTPEKTAEIKFCFQDKDLNRDTCLYTKKKYSIYKKKCLRFVEQFYNYF